MLLCVADEGNFQVAVMSIANHSFKSIPCYFCDRKLHKRLAKRKEHKPL